MEIGFGAASHLVAAGVTSTLHISVSTGLASMYW